MPAEHPAADDLTDADLTDSGLTDPERTDTVDPSGAGIDTDAEPRSLHQPRPVSAARLARRRRRARRRLLRRIRAGLMILAGLALLAGSWVGWRTYQAHGHLSEAAELVTELREEIGDANREQLSATLHRLQAESAAAAAATSDPLYRLATALPMVGDDLEAVGVIARVSDEMAGTVLPVVVDMVDALRPEDLAPRNGMLDLSRVQVLSADLQATTERLTTARRDLAVVNTPGLFDSVRTAGVRLWTEVDRLADLGETASRLSRLLPPMLGTDGPRSYLLVFQNTAELRATGGLFGSYAVVTADDGLLRIGDRGSVSRTIGTFDPPISALSDEQRSLYTERMASFAVDVNLTPDFPTAAELIATMYTERTGEELDGVIAADPTTLSYLLAGTGPVTVDGIELAADNVVKKLLRDVYRKFEDDKNAVDRDEFLASVSAEVFGTLLSGRGDADVIVDGLVRATQERRLLVWSADPGEQALLQEADLAGRLPEDDGTRPLFGVYLNDGTGAKLGYYLASAVDVTPGTCRADGRREWQVTVDLDYSAPAEGLPEYVLGLAMPGERYVLRTNVMLVGPSAGGILAVDRDGVPQTLLAGVERGRSAGVLTVDMKPGETTRVVFTAYTDPMVGAGSLDPQVRLTPGRNQVETSASAAGKCDPVR